MTQLPRIGRVDLSVADLGRSIDFYTNTIGLTVIDRSDSEVILGAGERPLLRLVELPGAKPSPRSTGLYHFALLLPTRLDLARSLVHLDQTRAPLTGFADHAVSEAIYLSDPDGHGIEIYRDRPRDEWIYNNGTLKMGSDPIDVQGILGELPAQPEPWSGLPDGTIMGHIHLQVSQIPATEQFYTELLGFDRVLRYGPSATFMSTDGYHHHIGGNTWASAGASPPPETAARLLAYEITLDDNATRDAIAARLIAADQAPETDGDALVTRDPSGNTIRLRIRNGLVA